LGWKQRYVLPAVKDVSFTLNRGETVGIVGESGSGKTTLATMLVRLIKATAGSVFLGDQEILHGVASIVKTVTTRNQVSGFKGYFRLPAKD
jgi:peptide/nickel transport system ATP-binding protein